MLCEYVMPWEKIEDIQLQPLQSDRFIWRWTESGQYSASSAYRSFFVGMSSLLGAKDIWRSTVPPKVKFFFWLAIHMEGCGPSVHFVTRTTRPRIIC